MMVKNVAISGKKSINTNEAICKIMGMAQKKANQGLDLIEIAKKFISKGDKVKFTNPRITCLVK